MREVTERSYANHPGREHVINAVREEFGRFTSPEASPSQTDLDSFILVWGPMQDLESVEASWKVDSGTLEVSRQPRETTERYASARGRDARVIALVHVQESEFKGHGCLAHDQPKLIHVELEWASFAGVFHIDPDAEPAALVEPILGKLYCWGMF